MKKLKDAKCWLKDLWVRITGRCWALASALGSIWRTHVDRMTSEPVYAHAVRDLIEMAAAFLGPGIVGRLLADQVFTVYMALLRLLRPATSAHRFETDDLIWA